MTEINEIPVSSEPCQDIARDFCTVKITSDKRE